MLCSIIQYSYSLICAFPVLCTEKGAFACLQMSKLGLGPHYDGIAYPSVAAGGTEEVNIALKPEFVDKHLELECVIKGRLAPDMRSVKYEKIGINEGGRIVWYSSFINESSIIDVVPTYFDTTERSVDLTGEKILDADDKVVSSEMVPTRIRSIRGC